MWNPYCSGTILVLKPVKWGKLFSKVHFFKAFPFSKVHFFRYSYVHFDLYSNVWSIFRQKMTKYVVEYIYYINFCVLATALLGFEILSLPKNVLVLVLIHLESLSKKSYYSEILPGNGRIWIFSKPYYSEIHTDRNRTMRGLPVNVLVVLLNFTTISRFTTK